MFLDVKANSLDDRSPFGQFWFEPVTARSSTGVRVGADQAMRLSAVYACVNVLAKTFAVLPFGLYKPQSKGGRKRVDKHWLSQLMRRRPNAYQNPFEWRQMLMGHLALRGNAYNRIYSNGAGQITDLLPMHPDRMRAEMMPNGDYRYLYKQPDGTDERIPRGEVWHLRWLSNNGIMGISPIEAQRDTIGTGLAANEYGARFFANDATPPGWIEHPGQFKDKTARENFRESMQAAQTGRNRGKLAVLEGGMKYHEVTVKNSDAQYLESREFTVREVARMFGVPPHLIGDLSEATFSNIEQQSLEFVIYTMTPIAEAWEASIEYSLLNEDDTFDAEFDLARLLRGDQAARADFYTKMFGIGAFNTNDVRIREGENPVEGGDMRFRPVNLEPLDPQDAADLAAIKSASAPKPPGTPGSDPETDQEELDQVPAEDAPPGGAHASRLDALAAAAADRLTRKELETIGRCRGSVRAAEMVYARHAPFIAQALRVPLEAAQRYCSGQLEELRRGVSTTFERDTRARLIALARG